MNKASINQHTTVRVEVNNLKAYYLTEQQGVMKEVRAVEDVSFEIEGSKFLAIVGESGCGKTTLAKVLYGFVNSNLSIVEGRVCYSFGEEEYEVSPTNNSLKDVWWEKIAYVPQGSLSALNPVRKLKDIFLDLTRSHGMPFQEEKVKNHLKMVKLPPYVLRMYPFELSGGMRQRVVIALATFLHPSVIIADEPTSALDVVTQRDILRLLKSIQVDAKSTFIFITHDISLVPDLADVMAIMYGGCIVEYGPTEVIFSHPRHPYTQFLLSTVPTIGDRAEKRPIPGNPVSLIDPPQGCRFQPRCPYRESVCAEARPGLLEVETLSGKCWVACWLCR
ncbi:MAG: ABC transporter ATP-binding protein [Candidatus Atribacteria bacterium]|nr:ABC transporter ATP-binding protein [Candidatus Atribacteria bacterium]